MEYVEEMTFWDQWGMIVVLSAIVVVLLVAVIIGSWHHVHKAGFKPKFVTLSDGSTQMEVPGFGGVQSARTERFNAQYKVGTLLTHGGRQYRITEIQPVANPTALQQDLKMVCYLEVVE